MMFFDFDDTLLIHYREQKLDATADAHRARLLRYEAENRGGYRVFDEIGEANTLVQHFLESCDGIPKYCITRVQDSMTLPYKSSGLKCTIRDSSSMSSGLLPRNGRPPS